MFLPESKWAYSNYFFEYTVEIGMALEPDHIRYILELTFCVQQHFFCMLDSDSIDV